MKINVQHIFISVCFAAVRMQDRLRIFIYETITIGFGFLFPAF